jgi:hypothetical protein
MKLYNKGTGTLALAAALALALTGCQNDMQQEGDFTGQRITVTAQTDGKGGDAETRTTLNGFGTEWLAGDKIGVFSPQAGASNIALTATGSGADSSFEGNIVWGAGAHDFYAYYPYTEGSFDHSAVPFSLPPNQTQSGGNNSDHLAALDFMIARPVTGVAPGGEVRLSFQHVFSLLEFRVLGGGRLSKIEMMVPSNHMLAFDGGEMGISPNGESFSHTRWYSSVALTLTVPATLTTNKATTPALYMMVSTPFVDDLVGDEITVRATIDGEVKTVTAAGFIIENGSKYTLVVDLDSGTAEPEPEDNVLALIPDVAFRAYCTSQMTTWDKNADGKLSFAEAAAAQKGRAGSKMRTGIRCGFQFSTALI